MVQIPTIETERLVLRAMRESDFAMMCEIFRDEETARFIGGVEPEFQIWRKMASYIGHWQLRGFGFFCLERKDNQEPVGFCGPWEPHGWPAGEIGYSLKKSSHGQGFVTEAAIASLKYAYETLGWTTAISFVDSKNKPSEAVAQRLGAVHDGEGILFEKFPANIWRHLPPAQFLEKFA